MSSSLASLQFLLSLLVILSWSGVAWAQSDAVNREDRARARALFKQGVEFSDTGRWKQAADRFNRALAIIPTAELRYNLASTLSKISRNLEATELLAEVASDREASEQVRQAAEHLREELSAKLGQLHIQRPASTAKDEVWLDGHRLPNALIAVPIAADPGTHRVVLRRKGQPISRCVTDVHLGQTSRCVLHPIQTTTSAPPTPQAKPRLRRQWWLWAALGTVAASAAIISLRVTRQRRQRQESNDTAEPNALQFTW